MPFSRGFLISWKIDYVILEYENAGGSRQNGASLTGNESATVPGASLVMFGRVQGDFIFFHFSVERREAHSKFFRDSFFVVRVMSQFFFDELAFELMNSILERHR